eukprot:408331_1
MTPTTLTLNLSPTRAQDMPFTDRPVMQLSKSLGPSPTKYPPPPPRKRPQRARSYWIKDNLQMSITSDIEHSDIDIEEHKCQLSLSSANEAISKLSLDIPYRNEASNGHRRRHSDMPKKNTKHRNIKQSSVDIKRNTPHKLKRSVTPRTYIKRTSHGEASPDTPDTPDTDLPSLRSVNKHKARVTQARRRKNRISTRKHIRRKRRKDSGITKYMSSSDSDSDHDRQCTSTVKKRGVSHKKSQSAPFAIRNIKLSDLYHEKRKKQKKEKKKKIRNGVKSTTDNLKIKAPKKPKSPHSPKKCKSPRSPLSRIRDNKVKRVSRSKFVLAFDEEEQVYRS